MTAAASSTKVVLTMREAADRLSLGARKFRDVVRGSLVLQRGSRWRGTRRYILARAVVEYAETEMALDSVEDPKVRCAVSEGRRA